MYLVTRAQMLQLVRDDLHEQRDAGAYTDARLIAHLQRATGDVWPELTAKVEGPGRVQEQRTIAAGDPDGYVPGNLVPMPARWQRLVVAWANGQRLDPGREDRADQTDPGRYWIDGPNQVTSGGLLTPYSARLLTSFDWAAGDVLEWLYVEQAPLWTDPTDPTISVQVDLGLEAVASAIAGMAAARANAKGDREAYTRNRTMASEAMAQFRVRRNDQQQSPRSFASYARRGYKN
jgi:hypothetical protein